MAPRGVNSPERCLALFDDKSKKWNIQPGLIAHSLFRNSPLRPSPIFVPRLLDRTPLIFQSFTAPRAPPSVRV